MNATKDTSPAVNKVSPKFLQEAEALNLVTAKFAAGQLTAVGFSRFRESLLATALQELAAGYGVSLELPLHLDSRGEYRIVAMPDDSSPKEEAGSFGEFAAILNQHNPRTGTDPRAVILSDCGWCYMNHFEVEKMVLTQSGILSEFKPQTSQAINS